MNGHEQLFAVPLPVFVDWIYVPWRDRNADFSDYYEWAGLRWMVMESPEYRHAGGTARIRAVLHPDDAAMVLRNMEPQ